MPSVKQAAVTAAIVVGTLYILNNFASGFAKDVGLTGVKPPPHS